jgi:hypothetical protein
MHLSDAGRGPSSGSISVGDADTEKYVRLAHVFLCKVMECIYINRCPEELSDLAADEVQWFATEVKRSESLRKLAYPHARHGWFKIDIILTDPDVIVERWTLRHDPIDPEFASDLNFGDSSDVIKKILDRRFSQMMRAIYSMLNFLPTKTLELALSQMPHTNRKITAICSHFHTRKWLGDDLESSGHTEHYYFGPVTSPVGSCIVECETYSDITCFIPKLPFILEEKGSAAGASSPSSPRGLYMRQDSDSSSYRKSSAMDLTGLCQDPMVLSELLESETLVHFCERLDRMPAKVPPEMAASVEEAREMFAAVCAELESLSLE